MSLIEVMKKKQLKEVTTDRFVIDLDMPTDYPPIKARHTRDGGVRDRFMAAKAELPDEISIVRPFNVDAFEGSNSNTVYVAENGDDANCGSMEKPLLTLKGALERMKGRQGGKIVFRGGHYNFDERVDITSEHSGTEASPLIITAQKGERVYFSAAQRIPAQSFGKVDDEHILSRLHPDARDRILVCDLKALGIEDYGVVGKNGEHETMGECGTMLVINDDMYDLARYPNVYGAKGRLEMQDKIYSKGEYVTVDGKKEWKPWELGIEDTKCFDWEWNDDIWVYGAFRYEWIQLFMRLGGLNRERCSIIGSEDARYSLNYVELNGFVFVNVLEELDVPGEWYLDRAEGKLYVYPKGGSLDADDDIRLITTPCDLIRIEKAENIIIDNIDMGKCRGSALTVLDCRQVLMQRCRVSSTTSSVLIEGGYRNGVIATRFEYFMGTACDALGGDKVNLIPCNNFVQNCMAFNSTVAFGITSGGCGNLIAHNYLHNTRFGDNGHNEGIFEYNIIEGGDINTSDSGMIYVGGGGNSFCGNHYRYNYFFDFARIDYGMYFDDLSRGMYAYGNIIVGNGVNPDRFEKYGKWWPSGGRTFNHHNGGEHVYYNNISIDAGYFAFGGDITYWLCPFEHWKGWARSTYEDSLTKRSKRYLDRYPTYKDFLEAVDQHMEDLKDPAYVEKSGWAERRLRSPAYNHYENNLILRADRPYKLDNGIETATGLETNYITNDDPGFVDWAARDYRFKKNAAIFEHIPDFVPPPFERMGPVDDYE
ncbi:MAG: hypothetical protein J6L92_09250 [Clostridia bacterium]|nr:hypothetical protein [Clostridia bacterium]